MTKNRIVNLIPHALNINGTQIISDGVARLKEVNEQDGQICGFPIITQQRGIVEGLPEQRDNIYYIVSRPIFDSMPERRDLLAVGEPIRDKSGKIIGAKNLIRRK